MISIENKPSEILLNLSQKAFQFFKGNYYFNARWYDADTGGFITEDPVKDGLLWYAYVSNNPLKFVDPTGLRLSDNRESLDDHDKGVKTNPGSKSSISSEPQKPKKEPDNDKDDLPKSDKEELDDYEDWIDLTRKLTEYEYGLEELLGLVDNAGLIDKEWTETYHCAAFVHELLVLLGKDPEKFLPDGPYNYVTTNMESLGKLLNDNPLPGWNVFYKEYDNGIDGHIGLIYMGDDGTSVVLHNGYDPSDVKDSKVNSYARNSPPDMMFRKERKNAMKFLPLSEAWDW